MGYHKNEQIESQEAVVNPFDPDDLDHADTLLEAARNSVDYEQGNSYAAVAAAHISLWWAKESRAAREAGEAYRKMMDAHRPPPAPMPAPPYVGF